MKNDNSFYFIISSKSSGKGRAGFSLLEILIGLALLALICGVVATNVFQRLHEGRVQTATIQMQNLSSALKDFRRHCGFYPTTEQGLMSLLQKPTVGRECSRYQPGGYLGDTNEIPLDPWDNDYYYEADVRTFNITSFGEDLQPGGEGNDADVSLNKASNQEEF